MTREELDRLLSVNDYPCVSILVPMEKKAPANRQNSIRIKGLLKRAKELLEREVAPREAAPVLEGLQSLVDTIEGEPPLDGLALFASPGLARRVDLPFSVPERVIIDREFATREIVIGLNRTARYRVLVLSDRPTRLLEGTGSDLVELKAGGFPAVYEGPGEFVNTPEGVLAPRGLKREVPHPGSHQRTRNFGFEPTTTREEYRKEFLHSIDVALGTFADRDPLPLAIVGVDRQLAFFENVSRHASSVVARIVGSHGDGAPHEIARLVWPLVEAAVHAQNVERARKAIDAAIKNRKVARGVMEVWRAAREGRGATLVVEEGYRFPARSGSSSEKLLAPNDPEGGPLTDAVDEILDEVLRKHGDVVFVPDGTLEGERIALTLRYKVPAREAA
jgi:hypothetical protein